MDYLKVYNSLIHRAKNRCIDEYTEKHHIIPRCIGGTDSHSNLVKLTPEEHFTAHVLLVKIYPDEKDLILAVNRMTTGHSGKRVNRKLYGWLRREFAKRMSENSSGSGNSQYGTIWINNGIESKKIKKNSEIPSGWTSGRIKTKKENKCVDCKRLICNSSLRCVSCSHKLLPQSVKKVTDEELLAVMKTIDMEKRGAIAKILNVFKLSPNSTEYYKRIKALVVKL